MKIIFPNTSVSGGIDGNQAKEDTSSIYIHILLDRGSKLHSTSIVVHFES